VYEGAKGNKGSGIFLLFCLEELLERRRERRGIKKVKQGNSKQFYEITMKFVIRTEEKTGRLC
jgi:hypothetical protein